MIVITTPTGSIGRRTLEHVIESGEPVRVIARDASRLPENTRDHVEVVEGLACGGRQVGVRVRGSAARPPGASRCSARASLRTPSRPHPPRTCCPPAEPW